MTEMHETLAAIIRNAFFDARNAGETMYQASDDAAARVLALLAPSTLRLQTEVNALVERWEAQRRDIVTDDWRASVYDTTMRDCLQELRYTLRIAASTAPVLEPV